MAEENTPSLGGFDILADMLTGGGQIKSKITDEEGNEIEDIGGAIKEVDPETLKKEIEEKEKGEESDEENDESDAGDDSDSDDDSGTDDGSGDDSSDEDDSGDSEDDSGDDTEKDDLGKFESDITKILNDRFSEELGWDIPEENAPKSVGEFVDLLREVVSEASKPKYSNDEVAAFDDFVKNGGDLRNFYKETVEGRVDTESIDMESSFDQKRVLREQLTNQGYSEDRIGKMIKRYEDAGVLEEEASDALELLKDYNEKNKKKLLAEQENFAREVEEQQQKFVGAVEESIKKLNDIRGFKISETDRRELLDYILVPDAEGLTQYQKDYMSDIKNLLESAYFTRKGDVLLNKSKEKGKSDAVKNLRDKINANKGDRSRKSGAQDSGRTSSGLSVLGSMLSGQD